MASLIKTVRFGYIYITLIIQMMVIGQYGSDKLSGKAGKTGQVSYCND